MGDQRTDNVRAGSDRADHARVGLEWGERKLHEVRDALGLVQVFALQQDLASPGRLLRFGNTIVQSAYRIACPRELVLSYVRGMALVQLFGDAAPRRALHLGLGGGSLPLYWHTRYPQLRQVVVELRRTVIEVAYRFFDLPRSERLRVLCEDGAAYLQRGAMASSEPGVATDLGAEEQAFDAIFLDAYHAAAPDPLLAQATTWQAAKACLVPGGWLICNTWSSDAKRWQAVREGLQACFATLFMLPIGGGGNVIFFASAGSCELSLKLLQERCTRLAARGEPQLAEDFQQNLSRLRQLDRTWLGGRVQTRYLS